MKKVSCILMMLIIIGGCEQEQTSTELDYLNKEIISYLANQFYNLNEFKDGKSVLNMGQQEVFLKNALKASEIYKNINEKDGYSKASEREQRILADNIEMYKQQSKTKMEHKEEVKK
ncbi:MAG: hypothetical protein LBN19_00320 [Endomicrobium sp.]|jgi:hypothetical protein|nr:hypothetical protein [Endomicrobium sp.]